MNSQKIFQLQRNPSLESEHVFIIIGTGLSGMSVFCQLVEKLQLEQSQHTYRIKIFEKNPRYFATGEPYHISTPTIWTLNNPAAKMRLTPNGQDAATLMQENEDKWKEKFPNIDMEYVPRSLIGMYLKAQYALYKKQARLNNIIVEEYCDSINDISLTESNNWKVKTEQSQSHIANTLFLCLGHAPSNLYTHLSGYKNYFTSTTPIHELERIPKNEDVYIIGGQASYVDIALLLAYQHNHTGKIHSLTRNASIITSKGNNDECNKKPLEELREKLKTQYQPNSLSLTNTKQLLWAIYQQSVKNPVNIVNPPSTKEALSYQITKYDHKSLLNSNIGNIDETRSFFLNFYLHGCYQKLWETLCDDDKNEFNTQLFTTIMAYLTGITPLNARLLLELYDREMILEHPGVSKIFYDDKKEKFIIEFKNKEPIEVNTIINASGYGYDVSKVNIDTPLLTQLIEKGLMVPKKLGGLEITDRGQLINKNKEVISNIFCIGPVASYNHKYPTPYASFIAVGAAKNAIEAINLSPIVANDQ